MKNILVKFNNIQSPSYKAYVGQSVTVISHKVVLNEDIILRTITRHEQRLDKVRRDTSNIELFHVDVEKGVGTILVNEESVDEDVIKFLERKDVRLFINSITMNGEITAITGFTASKVIQ